MSDWLYDWMKDLAVPALAGVGGIVVGTGAMVAAFTSNRVATQSLDLAQQVRDDEQKREAQAARERYREQLFQTLEPCVTVLLEHRAELMRSFKQGTLEEVALRSLAIGRLRLVLAVAQNSDVFVVAAAVRTYRQAALLQQPKVFVGVIGQLVATLPALLTEPHDSSKLVKEIDTSIAEQTAKADDAHGADETPPSEPS